jgi:RNase P/RNase MRP subunit p29
MDLLVVLTVPRPLDSILVQSKHRVEVLREIEVLGQTQTLFTIDLGEGQSQLPVSVSLFKLQMKEATHLQVERLRGTPILLLKTQLTHFPVSGEVIVVLLSQLHLGMFPVEAQT